MSADEYGAFVEQLIAVRKSAGLTQQDVANRLGKPQSFVSKYERGDRRLDVVEFIRIVRAMGADPIRVLKAVDTRRQA